MNSDEYNVDDPVRPFDRAPGEYPGDDPVSRRDFLRGGLGGLAGAAALAAGLGGPGGPHAPESVAALAAGIDSPESVAAQLAGRRPADVKSVGVEPGRVRLAFNENPLGASPAAIEAVLRHQDWMNRYDYTTTLQQAIIRHHGLDIPRPSGFDFKATGDHHGLMLGVGTTELLQILALQALMKHGEVLEALPSYGQITRVADELRDAGHEVRALRSPVLPDGNHDLEDMARQIGDRTGLVIICNPHNPTGALLPHQQILEFIDQAPPHVLVAIDEVYVHFVRDPAYRDFIEVAKERENVIVLRTFSKVYGLGGIRVGYAVAHRDVIYRLAPFSMGLLGRNVLSVHAATAALGDEEHVRRSRQAVWDGNDYLTAELERLGARVVPSHACFLWADFGRETQRIVRELWSRRVMVRAGAGQWASPNHIRVSTGSREENEAFVWALERTLG